MDQQTLQAISELTNKLATDIGAPGDLDETLQRIANAAKEFFAADLCVIFAINPITGKYRLPPIIAGDLKSEGNRSRLSPPRADGRAKEVLRTGLLLVRDLWQDQYATNTFTGLENIHSFAALAIRSEHYLNPLAVLYVDYRHLREFSEQDETLFRFFAQQVAVILHNTWLLRRYQEVTRIGQEINQELENIDALFRKFRQHAAGILDIYYFFMLAVYQPQAGTLDLYIMEEGQPITLYDQTLQGTCKWVVETQRPLMVRHKSKEAEQLPVKLTDIPATKQAEESLIFVPLTLRDVPLGVLLVQHPQPNAYDNEDLHLLQLLANHVALALANIDLFRKLTQVNDTGQLLTKELSSARVLQEVADRIQKETTAEIIILYPYQQITKSFQLPPILSGALLQPDFPQPSISRPDDVATLAVRLGQSEFARDSRELYARLKGDVSKRRGNFEIREKVSSVAAVPLRVGNETVGVLFINFRQAQRFNAPQKQFVQNLANFAAIAINNSREFSALADDRAALMTIQRDIVRQLGSHEIFDVILQKSLTLTGSEAGILLLYDRERNDLRVAAQRGAMPAKQQGRLALDEGIVGWLIDQRQATGQTSINVEDVRGEPWRRYYAPFIKEVRSQLSVLLIENGELCGAISMESRTPSNFSDRHEALLKSFADLAVITLRNAEHYQDIAKSQQQLKTLHEIDQQIIRQVQAEDSDQIMRLIVESAWRLVETDYAELLLYHAGAFTTIYATRMDVQGKLQPVEKYTAQENKLDQGILAHVVQTQQSYRSKVPAAQDEYYVSGQASAAQAHAESEVAVPLLTGGDTVIGVLNLESMRPYAFSDADTKILEMLADQAVIAIQNARNFAQIEVERKRFADLYHVGQKLSKVTDIQQLEQAYKIVLDVAQRRTSGRITLRRYDEQRQELLLEPGQVRQQRETAPAAVIRRGEGWSGWVAQHKQTLQIDDADNPPLDIGRSPFVAPEMKSYLIVPIVLHDIDFFYGTLNLSHEQVKFFTAADVQLFEGLARQLALTIHRLQMVREKQQAEKMDFVNKWSKWIVHDLPDYLGRVRSNIDDVEEVLQERNIASQKIDEALHAIHYAVQNVLNERHNLLAALNDPKLKVEMAAAPLKEILDSAVKAALLPETIYIDSNVDDDELKVRVNATQVIAILRGLLTNAKDAISASGTIRINAFSIPSSTPQRYIAIDVSDTGKGVLPNIQPYIFMPGFSTKGGAGLGLSMAQQIARQNGGELALLASTPGSGATFRLILPQATGVDNDVSS